MMRLQMRLAVFAVLAAAAWAAGSSESRGAEPAQKFLAALREADYFDTALEYLDQLAGSPLTPASLKEILSYERGATLVAGAKHQRDFTLREKQLDEAQKALDEFVAQQPNHPLTFSARSELGNLLVERGRLKMERGKKVTDKPGKDALAKEAYGLYVKSAEIYESLEGELKKKLDAFPKAIDEKKDAKLFDQREQARADYLQTQLLSVAVKEETADTLDKASKEYKDVLTNAAKEYGEIYNKYRSRLAGMYARMYQGRCHQKVGNFKEALSYYDELLQNQDEPRELHTLKTKVLLLAVDCWMAESQKKYAEVIDKGGKWLDKAYPDEIRSPDMMALRLAVARSSKLFADQLKKEKPKDPQINQLMTEARKLAQYVAKFPSDHQKEAQKLAGELGIGGPSTSGDAPQPKTFADARNAGKDVLDGVQVAKVKLEGLPARIRDEQNADAKKQLQDELKEAQDLIKSGDAEALRLFQLAQRLAVNDTPPEDLSVVRYFICYLFYSMQDYENAAVMGEFVAQRFPESGGARQCAKIAMASYLKQYANAKTDCKPLVDQILGDFDKDKDGKLTGTEIEGAPAAKQAELKAADVDGNGKIETAEIVRMFTRYESEHIVEICNYITSKWPDQPEAQEALATLISFMITENQLDKAQAYLEKIPEESKQRGMGELRLGQALWGSYLRGMHAIHEQERIASEARTLDAAQAAQFKSRRDDLQTLKTRGEKTLTDGVARMEKGGAIDTTFASATLSLAQIYVDTERADKAIELLEKAQVGPLTIVTAKHEAAAKEGYSEEVYKTALRAYISALAGSKTPDELVKKAEGVMDGLKSTVAGAENGSKKLFAIYFSLARELETQMELASAENKKNLAKGFETFLNQVRATATEVNVMYWVASTYFSMGESYGVEAGGAVGADAKRYYGEAAKTYEEILAKAKAGTLTLDPQLAGQLSLQLAKTRRAMGDYDASIKIFIQVLEKSPSLLSVQIEAAKTYEEWGERSNDTKYFVHAIQGSMENKTGRSKIWGWLEIAKRTAGNPQFRDAFYESRYHITLARYKYALAQKTADEKTKHLKLAEESLSKTYQGYPAVDGDQATNKKSFREQYEAMARTLQKALGKKETGLAAYDLALPGAVAQPGATQPGAAQPGAAQPGAVKGAAAQPAATQPAAKPAAAQPAKGAAVPAAKPTK